MKDRLPGTGAVSVVSAFIGDFVPGLSPDSPPGESVAVEVLVACTRYEGTAAAKVRTRASGSAVAISPM
ncbi:hypothetical protein GCM10009675_39600 [Prauserella alba]|uniref:Uncharacterized protein n=1 Tax=Prauserella alba TaxID=176898 RepID=A0ABP4G4S4_9PSEU